MRDTPVNNDKPNIINPRIRSLRKIEVDTANTSKVCLLGKEESVFEGIRIPVRFSRN